MKNGATYFKPDSRGDKYPMIATDKNYCLTDFCRNVVHRKNAHSPYCSKCRNRRWREKFPLHYSFKNLRVRAKQRGKDFTLTRQEYIKFAIQTDYASMKGRSSLSLTINRIDNSRGYHADNIESITKSENSRKQFVPYFAHQMENAAYKPSAEDLAELEAKMKE